MKYYNQDQFPVEPTEIVAFSEVLKVADSIKFNLAINSKRLIIAI